MLAFFHQPDINVVNAGMRTQDQYFHQKFHLAKKNK